MGRRTRWGLLAAALGVLAVLAVARWLRPDPQGYGTHQQLGLRPCAFRTMTGKGCPSCGMTTAFAWFVRGRPVQAWNANPAGLILAAISSGLVPWMLVGSLTGHLWGVRSLDESFLKLTLAVAAFSLLTWMLRLLL